jgi:hypothetical protein
MRRIGLVSAVGLAATFAACGDDNDPKTDTTDTADTTDTVDTTDTADSTGDSAGDSTEDSEDTSPDTVTPTFATLTFSIDDRANKTYEAADGLAWKGSFSYDKATNTLTKNSSWSGPFVNLYDDGPAPGGHEPDGATANDNIWSIAVKVATPEADEVFEYGAISGSTDGSDGSWIWSGTNGTVTVPAGSTARVDATGLVIAKHGTVDLLLTIDVSNNGANLATGFQSAFTDVKVKGSAWGWNEIAMVDDGTKGDATAGDKIYSFRLSDNLGKHDGLLKPGAQAQFVFVLGGVEYKAGGAPPTDGVDASLYDGTAWVDAEVKNQEAGDKNTYVEVPTKVRVNFTIDDSVNKTYEAADGLAWKGSFSYDAATNTLTKNGSWGGPFVNLYDDGPWNEGGHEPAGAVAGDHKWGISAWVSNAADTFEYGAIRGSVAGADGEWIWTGSNGTFAVTEGQLSSITAAGLTIAAFGTIDFRLVIDVSNNGANLATGFQSAFTDVKVKGSAWGWTEIACKDDGTAGDKTAADGKYTFVLSENLGKHNGLLKVGDMPEFIYVLGGVEYKNGAGEGAKEGVTAYSDYSAPGADACVAATASCMMETLEVAGNKNTMITVGE